MAAGTEAPPLILASADEMNDLEAVASGYFCGGPRWSGDYGSVALYGDAVGFQVKLVEDLVEGRSCWQIEVAGFAVDLERHIRN